jgi:predicted nucleic acid-binding protein
LSSELRPFDRHDRAHFRANLAYRARDQLPFDLGADAADAALMLDATVYIDAQNGKLPSGLAARIAGAEVRHSAVALGEIAAGLGLLDPGHGETPAVTLALRETLARADPLRTHAPSADAWLEASLLAGILARTQGLPRADRRKLLNDALIFLGAAEAGAVLVSRNIRDMDLLLQIKPEVAVLLYDQQR